MRPGIALLIAGCFAACAHAGNDAPDHAAMQADVDACQRLPADAAEACLDALFAPTPEVAQQLRAQQARTADYHGRVARALAAGGEARDLALAVILKRIAADQRAFAVEGATVSPRPDAEAERWWRTAFERSDGDVLATTLLLHAAKSDMPAQRRMAVERWRALEPDNLAAWMVADGSVETWLPMAQATTHYDSHAYARLRWMAERLRAWPRSPVEAVPPDPALVPVAADPHNAAAIDALGIWMAEWQPGYQRIVGACRGEILQTSPERAAECRHVAGVLAETADVTIAQSIGLAMQRHTAGSDDERTQAEQASRGFQWQTQQRGVAASADPDGDLGVFLRLLNDPAVRSERELAARMLAEAGVPDTPPADWRSPWAEAPEAASR